MAITVPARAHDQRGRFMPGSTTADSPQAQQERRKRAAEWRDFRKSFLYSQQDLADALEISRRTVVAVEAGECIPVLKIQRRFRDLKREQERLVTA